MTLVWAPGFNGITDPDAQTYLAAVETADGQAIEGDVALAINDFVVGCKLDGIWDAIKASCILAGARTLSGALVPLKGTAPTNNNFVSGDYDRETGLVGNGSTKYLDSNRAGNADPQDSFHATVYASTAPTTGSGGSSNDYGTYIGNVTGATTGARSYFREPNNGTISARNTSSTADSSVAAGSSTGLIGMQRNNSSSYTFRANQASGSFTRASQTPNSASFGVYRVLTGTANGTTYSNARLAFYSIGEAIDLEKLDTRVTRLMHLITYTQTSGLPGLSTMDLDAASYIGGAYRAGATLS